MNKCVSILLLTILVCSSFLPNMDTCELSKIPQLVQHFKEHKALENNSLGFLDFMQLHYGFGEKSGKHDRQEDHDNLPFHGHTFHALEAALTETSSFLFYKFESNPILIVQYFYFDYSEYSAFLLQPPKHVA